MKIIQYLQTKAFRKQMLLIVVALVITLFGAYKWVAFYTKHGKSVPVPVLKGLELSDATDLLDEQNFKYSIDSIYTSLAPAGTVYEQEPEPGAAVKENRTIYLTVVSNTPPIVKLPDLIDVSLREATSILESYGIKIGQLIYKPDLAQNAVLGLVYNGKTVQKGFAIRKGATLDLLVGDGYGNVKVDIPNLTGLNFEEAQFVLNASKLRLGTIIFEGNSTDTFNTKIYKQSPAFSTDTAINKIGQGSAIDIYVKED